VGAHYGEFGLWFNLVLVNQGETVQHGEEGRRRRVQVQLSYTEAFGLYVVERGEEERRKGGMTWFLKA
jgi:hypothetical protein